MISEYASGGFCFQYESSYLAIDKALPISLTMPLREKAYESEMMFAFFDGLIPEGWLLALATKNWKIQLVVQLEADDNVEVDLAQWKLLRTNTAPVRQLMKLFDSIGAAML